MNKALKLAFVASITLNVLFIGVLLGQLPQRFDRRFSPRDRLEAAVKELPEPARSRVGSRMEQMHKEIDPIRDQMEKTRNEIIAVFVAEPFDEVAYDRAVSKIDELRLQMGKRLATNVKEIAKELPAEQRKTLARAFERSPRQAAKKAS
jgi:uncharacterized membrane protein